MFKKISFAAFFLILAGALISTNADANNTQSCSAESQNTAAGCSASNNNCSTDNIVGRYSISQLEEMVLELQKQITRISELLRQKELTQHTSNCGNDICETGETISNCAKDCSDAYKTGAGTTGYDHYCQTYKDIEKGDVLKMEYVQTSDYYDRHFMIGIDCPQVNEKRVYTQSGCESCKNGGQYCNTGTGGNGSYSYTFNENLRGTHKICIWPSSDRESADEDAKILGWKVKTFLNKKDNTDIHK